MTSVEEEECLQWLKDNPQLKTDAMKQYDKKLLEGLQGTGRTIAVNNITLGNQIFDNLIGGPQAKTLERPKIDMKAVGHKGWTP
eukprot:13195045-Heterocapsa_arctica.AAC.1